MDKRIIETLEPVCRRQRAPPGAALVGLGAVGAARSPGSPWAAWRWWGTGQVSPSWSTWRPGGRPDRRARSSAWRGAAATAEAASAVDARYGLKDRVVTALDFGRRAEPTPLHELQLADAEEHLRQVDPRRVVPFRIAEALPWAVGACLGGPGPPALAPAERPGQPGRPPRRGDRRRRRRTGQPRGAREGSPRRRRTRTSRSSSRDSSRRSRR